MAMAAAENYCGFFSAVISPSSRKISPGNSNSMFGMRVILGQRGRAGVGGGGGMVVMMNLISEPDYFEVGRLIGSYGFMNITRLYEGRLVQGPKRGTPVIFKVYPGQQVGGIEADAMAANELSAHASLQQEGPLCQNIQLLLGGFETKTGEQWLAFRNHGMYTAADYATFASKKMSKVSWNPFEKDVTLDLRKYFVTRLLQGTIQALSYMHEHHRLHQSLGPYSVVLNYEAGLLFAYLAFVPFCEAGIMDSLSLRRLLENTFQLDLEAARE